MSDVFSYDEAVAGTAHGDIVSVANGVQASLDELTGFVNRVKANWEGDEMELYDGVQLQWNNAADTVRRSNTMFPCFGRDKYWPLTGNVGLLRAPLRKVAQRVVNLSRGSSWSLREFDTLDDAIAGLTPFRFCADQARFAVSTAGSEWVVVLDMGFPGGDVAGFMGHGRDSICTVSSWPLSGCRSRVRHCPARLSSIICPLVLG